MSYPTHPKLSETSSGKKAGSSNIVRTLSDKVMKSGRRLEHYSAQRAQDVRDALPLIHNDQLKEKEKDQQQHDKDQQRLSTRSSNYYPPSPPPTYQPHQLIAVCFNHMAGRDCDHCRNIDRSLSDRQSVSSPESHHTLGYQSQSSGYQRRSHASFHDEKTEERGEEGEKPGPPPVVGFWDSRLGKVRLQLLGLWAKTSKQASPHASKDLALTLW